jgi:hypothetical protein
MQVSKKMAIRPLFSAACETCTTSFGYPSLGDFAYGSSIFSSTDGRRFAYVEALSPFPSRLSALLKATGSRLQFGMLSPGLLISRMAGSG